MEVWYQVEFWSYLEERWVPLFAQEKSEASARQKLADLLPGERGRVVKVTQTKEPLNANQKLGKQGS